MDYRYERLDENYNIQYCPINDYDGSISGTGHCVMWLKQWFDENPEERKRLGWIKHYYYKDNSEFKKDYPDYDPMLHYLSQGTEVIDEYTIKDRYSYIPKTDKALELEEILEMMHLYVPSGTMIVDSQGGAIL